MVKSNNPRKSAGEAWPKNNIAVNGNLGDHTSYNNRISSDSIDPTPEIEKVIPVIEEDFDLTKKTVIHETSIANRMTTKTEKIE